MLFTFFLCSICLQSTKAHGEASSGSSNCCESSARVCESKQKLQQRVDVAYYLHVFILVVIKKKLCDVEEKVKHEKNIYIVGVVSVVTVS